MPRYLAVGGSTVDDIVDASGAFHRAVPGGNAVYTALGAHLWADDVAIVSFVGDDHRSSDLDLLCAHGIDVSLVERIDGPSIRLWVLYEEDGKRQILYQHRSARLETLGGVVARAAPALTGDGRCAAGLHVAALPVALQRPILSDLRGAAELVTLDSIEARGTVGGDLARYAEADMFDGVAAFLPSRAEFDVLRGDRPEAEAAAAIVTSGASHVILKDGSAGVRIYGRREGVIAIPAFPTVPVDATGAGDAFCGGFMVGLAETGDVVEAALRGAVSASFVIEDVGGLHLLAVTRSAATRRLDALRHLAPGPS
jgi:ribokinase